MDEKNFGVKNYNLYFSNGRFAEITTVNGERFKGKIIGAYLDVILLVEGSGPADPRINSLLAGENPLIIQRSCVMTVRVF